MTASDPADASSTPLAPRPAEALLIAEISRTDARAAFCVSLGRAQLGRHLAELLAARGGTVERGSTVACDFLDCYQARQAAEAQREVGNLTIACRSDPPETEFDLVALPLQLHGDAEWTRELLQAAHCRLRIGGSFWTATDNPRDRWLREELEKLFDRITARRHDTGIVYHATKTQPLKKLKSYSCEFVFRDDQRLVRAFSRPGVFSHRHIDPGARALIETLAIEPHHHVFDIGCGAGTVTAAAALRATQGRVFAVDSNARAVECTRTTAQLNGLENVMVTLDDQARCDAPGEFDIALGNPPYFSGNRIAEIFVDSAARALKPRGLAMFVTKSPDWFVESMCERFVELRVVSHRGYAVVMGRKL